MHKKGPPIDRNNRLRIRHISAELPKEGGGSARYSTVVSCYSSRKLDYTASTQLYITVNAGWHPWLRGSACLMWCADPKPHVDVYLYFHTSTRKGPSTATVLS